MFCPSAILSDREVAPVIRRQGRDRECTTWTCPYRWVVDGLDVPSSRVGCVEDDSGGQHPAGSDQRWKHDLENMEPNGAEAGSQ